MSKFKLELDQRQAETLRLSVRAKLQSHGIHMLDETPKAIHTTPWYAETSHVDELVRVYVRLFRIVTGHKQFNAVIPYTEAPKS